MTPKIQAHYVEALVNGIMYQNDYHDPLSESYKLRNPLLLKSFARLGKHQTDENGRRVFPGFLNGYKAALYDMELKVTGSSRAVLKPTDQLQNLFRVYGVTEPYGQESIVKFLRKALGDVALKTTTPLEYFLSA